MKKENKKVPRKVPIRHRPLHIKIRKLSRKNEYTLSMDGVERGTLTHADVMMSIGERILQLARESGEDV